MTTYAQPGQQHAERPTHPFDMEKSEFEKLLDKDFNIKGIEEAQEEARYAQSLEDHLTRSIWMARAIDRLRLLLSDELMELVVMPLMNTRLGFKTDRPNKRDAQPYSLPEVRECVVEALIRGAYIVGNEFNIISRGTYLTKEFFQRKIREFPDLTDFVPLPGVPVMKPGGAVVPYTVSYKLKGQGVGITREIPVKVNEMMGTDAIIGKSDRKMWASVYGILTGSQQSIPDGDVSDIDTTYTSPGAQPVNTRLAAAVQGIEAGAANRTLPQTPPAPANPPAPTTPPAAATEAPAPSDPPSTLPPRRTGGRPQAKVEKPAEPAKPAAPAPETAKPAETVAQTFSGYKKPLPAGVEPIDWLRLQGGDVFMVYDALSMEERKTHWAHVTEEVQAIISAACKTGARKEAEVVKQEQDAAAETPADVKQPDESQEFVDSKSDAQLKVWFGRLSPDLLRVGREAAGVTNLSEANKEQLRKAAYVMRVEQGKTKT